MADFTDAYICRSASVSKYSGLVTYMVSQTLIIIGTANALLPVWHQAITKTKRYLMVNWTPSNK